MKNFTVLFTLLLLLVSFGNLQLNAQCDEDLVFEVVDLFCEETGDCQGSDFSLTIRITSGGLPPLMVYVNDELYQTFETFADYIDIYGIEIPTAYTIRVDDSDDCSYEVSDTHTCFLLDPSCNDGLLSGDELRTDCGGSACPGCLQVTYAVSCDDVAGLPEITYIFPEDTELPVCYFGNVNNSDYFDLQVSHTYPSDNEQPNLRVIDNAGRIAVITDPLIQCTKQSEQFECPESSDFELVREIIFNNSTETYYLKLDLSSGEPPYQITDAESSTDDVLVYYDMYTEEAVHYLGPFNYTKSLFVTVIDGAGCEIDALVSIGDTITEYPIANEFLLPENAFKVFPTMSSDLVSLSLYLSDVALVSARLHSLDGREVKMICEQEQFVGKQDLDISLADLPSGLYLLNVQVNGVSAGSRRIIKL